jgi:hypothetical protein
MRYFFAHFEPIYIDLNKLTGNSFTKYLRLSQLLKKEINMKIANFLKSSFYLLTAILAAIGLSGCSHLSSYVRSCQDLEVSSATNAPLRDAPIASESAGYSIQTMPYRSTVSIDEIAGFNPHAGTLWPGALIQRASLHDGVFASIVTARRPLTITISDISGNNVRSSEKVQKPDYASTEAARLKLVNQGLISPAKFSYTETEFYSLEEAMLKIGASANWLGGSLKASLDSDKYSEQHNLIVRFTQENYTVSIEPPSSPVSYFGSGTTVEDLLPYSNPTNNPITYVQSVTYGRMAILIVSSSLEISKIKEAVDAAYTWASGSASANLSSDVSSMIQNNETKLLVIGGDSQLALKAAGPNVLNELRNFIQNGGSVAQALPISYRINYLANNKPALISFTTDYNRINKTEIPRIKDLTVDFDTNDDDKDDDTYLSVSINGNGKTYATYTQNGKNKYDDHSHHTERLTSNDVLFIRDLPSAKISIHIQPTRHDTWKFNYHLHGTTTDGRNYISGRDGITLNQDNRDLSDSLNVIQP